MNSTQKLLDMMGYTTELAKLGSLDLAAKMNKVVNAALRYAETLATESAKAKRERDDLAAEASVAEGERREALVAELEKAEERLARAVQLRDEAADGFNEYMEKQRAQFASKNLNPWRRFKEMIVPCGTQTMKDGRVLQLMRILPRDVSLEPVDMDDDDHKLSVMASRSASDNVGLARDQRRGRYNDGSMLVNEQAANLDLGEVMPFRVF